MSDARPNFASILAAPFSQIGRDFRDLLRNPLAFFGGVGGAGLVVGALLVGVFVVGQASAGEEDENTLEIDFEPGALVKLGKKPEEKDLPEKIITQDSRPEEQSKDSTLTDDDKAKPTEDKPKPDKKETSDDKLPKKDPKLPPSKNPTDKNTPYDDLPTVDYNVGDPFGSPDGWADRMKDGDPWATAVMAALNNNVKGYTYGAAAQAGDFRFQLEICPDGKVSRVNRKGGSLDVAVMNTIELDIRRLQLPKPPPAVAKKMGGQCAKIRYTFVWSARGVK